MPENGQAPGSADALRLDKWFWHARFFKSRALASKFCQSGKARVNGAAIRKAHYMVRPEAQGLYEDLQPPIPKAMPEAENAAADTEAPPPPPPPKRDPGSGRPTKSDRRAIDRLMGREGGKRGMVGRMLDAILRRKSEPD